MSVHEKYMRQCFSLAKKAIGQTSPNPYVGSVIVKDDKVIAKGFHKKSGTAHAELDAIQNKTQDLVGSTLYCNLEPCCHTNKKTPPCAQRIVKEGIRKVVISNLDPNPAVAGKGVQILEEAGIEVITGILKEEGLALNEVFFTHITKKRPFIHLKWAQTLDGKMATTSFDSKWITNPKSREHSHKERNLYDAIVVGANTVNQDNPNLTIRLNQEVHSKKRVIISPSGDVSLDLNLFTDEFKDNSLIITAPSVNKTYPIRHLTCDTNEDGFILTELLETLYQEGIHSIYIEGGAKLLNSFVVQRMYDRLSVYIAPKIIGDGISSTQQLKLDKMNKAIQFENGVWSVFDSDTLFESKRNICLQD